MDDFSDIEDLCQTLLSMGCHIYYNNDKMYDILMSIDDEGEWLFINQFLEINDYAIRFNANEDCFVVG